MRLLLLVGAVLALSACDGNCNATGKPVQVVSAVSTGQYRSWVNWTVLTRQGDNTFVYCRGAVGKDIPIKTGQFYNLRSFNRDMDI